MVTVSLRLTLPIKLKCLTTGGAQVTRVIPGMAIDAVRSSGGGAVPSVFGLASAAELPQPEQTGAHSIRGFEGVVFLGVCGVTSCT